MKNTVCNIFLCLFITISYNAKAGIIAFDMVNSLSQNLLSYQNDYTDAFSSADDGLQKYQLGRSSYIPLALIDESRSINPLDKLGVIAEDNQQEFFGIIDTINDKNNSEISATWNFNISGFHQLLLSLDIAAMGDFENSDYVNFSYSIDQGLKRSLFSSTVDTSLSQGYTMQSGTLQQLDDPMFLNGNKLNNRLQTFSSAIIGSGLTLQLTLTAQANGADEVIAFQNMVIQGEALSVPEPASIVIFMLALIGLITKEIIRIIPSLLSYFPLSEN